jgi:hypothetical protein
MQVRGGEDVGRSPKRREGGGPWELIPRIVRWCSFYLLG